MGRFSLKVFKRNDSFQYVFAILAGNIDNDLWETED